MAVRLELVLYVAISLLPCICHVAPCVVAIKGNFLSGTVTLRRAA